VIVTGDSTQKDLPKDAISGLDVAVKVVSGIDDIAICKLSGKDVVRHPLVQKIVNAYEKYEEKNAKRNKKKAPVAKIVKNKDKD
jgi:phosphate starvation-inducible PhoH-like protein